MESIKYMNFKKFIKTYWEKRNLIKEKYIHLCRMLTESPHITDDVFIMNIIKINENGLILIGYIGDPNSDFFEIVTTGTLFIEAKIIRAGRSVAHIEDIIVHEKYRGKGISKVIIESLKEYAESMNCYKIILDCSEENIQLYKKYGFVEKGVQMAIYGKN